MTTESVREKIHLGQKREVFDFFTGHQQNLELIENILNVKLVARGTQLTIVGDPIGVSSSKKMIPKLVSLIEKGYLVKESDFKFAVESFLENEHADLGALFLKRIVLPSTNHIITPKSAAQTRYIETIRNTDVVIAIGPAGTGKTYLAIAMAVLYLLERYIRRIILVRPAVEAGERLGFLPGTIEDKIDPYLRPLYDALYDMMEPEKVSKLIEKGSIEIAPMAYMRGRTLNEAFIILDEAQNTTPVQMKMFLTRLGFGSKAIITGDITQVDLPTGTKSGLVDSQTVLKSIPGIQFVYFSEKDVVRHSLVQQVIKAYEQQDQETKTTNENACKA